MKLKLIIYCIIAYISCFDYLCAADKLIIATVPKNNGQESKDEVIIKEVFKMMNIDIEIKYYPWNRCIEMMESKKIDGMFSVKKTEEREKFIIFPEEEIEESEWVFFYRKDKNIEYNECSSLKGKVVAATSGYAYGDKFWGNKEFTIDEGYNDVINMKKVINGRVDFFICNKKDGIEILNDFNEFDNVTYCSKPYMSYPLFIGFSYSDKNKELAEKISPILKKVKKSKKLN